MNIQTLIEELRKEGYSHIEVANEEKNERIWIARMSAAHVLFSLTTAIGVALYAPQDK